MRILSYKNEKQTTCMHCGTRLAYSDDDVHRKSSGDSVDSVEGFLNWVKSNKYVFLQLKKSQLNVLGNHLDWVCYSETYEPYIICPHCNKHIDLPPLLKYIEIYPEGSDTEGDVKNSFYFDEFNTLTHLNYLPK